MMFLIQFFIKTKESAGTSFFTHKVTKRILTNYYRDILGKSFPPQDLLDLEEIYPNSLNLSSLTSPFSEAEIHNALKQIPRDKSPIRMDLLSFRISGS
jgi:hypothetical protein